MNETGEKSQWEASRDRKDGREIWWFAGPAILWYIVMMDLEPIGVPYWKSIGGLVFVLLIPLGLWVNIRAYRRKDELEKLLYIKGMAAGFIVSAHLAIIFGMAGSLAFANRRGDGTVGWPTNIGTAVEVTVGFFGGFIIFIAGMITFCFTQSRLRKKAELDSND